MTRTWIAACALIWLGAAPAQAQEPNAAEDLQARLDGPVDTTLPGVETLTCDQMSAELVTAGQRMSSQLDPSFAENVQSMQDDASRRRGAGIGSVIGMTAMCAVPGLGMACAAVQQAQMANMGAQAAENRERMGAMVGQLSDSTEGVDLQRMDAISTRWTQENCQAPQSPPQP